MKTYISRLKKLESKFNCIYPNEKKATYSTELNFSDDLNKPFQRWYRYKEGFSVELVKKLIKEYSTKKNGTIFDPFLGSGSTLLAANDMDYNGIGCETNPFSYFLSKTKLNNYTKYEIESFKKIYKKILKSSLIKEREYSLPKLSISNKVLNKKIEKYYMSIKEYIIDVKNKKIQNLLMLGWLSVLDEISNYKKAGNGLKTKRINSNNKISKKEIYLKLNNKYDYIYDDLLIKHKKRKNKIYSKSCLNIIKQLNSCSIDGMIFSPPYANCFDYTEIYKLELWFGDFVSDYNDLKLFRKASISSNLNKKYDNLITHNNEIVTFLTNELDRRKVWDKRISEMLKHYYDELFSVIDEAYRILDNDGFVCIVIGNSAYGGIVFPSDLIIADYAQKIGFCVDKIEIYRYIITSSQQYKKTKGIKNYLRESVVCLKK